MNPDTIKFLTLICTLAASFVTNDISMNRSLDKKFEELGVKNQQLLQEIKALVTENLPIQTTQGDVNTRLNKEILDRLDEIESRLLNNVNKIF